MNNVEIKNYMQTMYPDYAIDVNNNDVEPDPGYEFIYIRYTNIGRFANEFYGGKTVKSLNGRAGKYGRAYLSQPKMADMILSAGWDNVHSEVLLQVPANEADTIEADLIQHFNLATAGLNSIEGSTYKEDRDNVERYRTVAGNEIQTIPGDDNILVYVNMKHAKHVIKVDSILRPYIEQLQYRIKESNPSKSKGSHYGACVKVDGHNKGLEQLILDRLFPSWSEKYIKAKRLKGSDPTDYSCAVIRLRDKVTGEYYTLAQLLGI